MLRKRSVNLSLVESGRTQSINQYYVRRKADVKRVCDEHTKGRRGGGAGGEAKERKVD